MAFHGIERVLHDRVTVHYALLKELYIVNIKLETLAR